MKTNRMKDFEMQNHSIDAAAKKVAKLKSIYLHIGAYVSINSILFIFWKINFFSVHGQFWETTFYITGALGGVGLLGHWIAVFGYKLFLPKNWEEKKIQKLINKEKNK